MMISDRINTKSKETFKHDSEMAKHVGPFMHLYIQLYILI